MVTIPVGYADCYWRHLSNRGVVIRVATGELFVHIIVLVFIEQICTLIWRSHKMDPLGGPVRISGGHIITCFLKYL